MAKQEQLSPDLLAWDQQPDETPAQYEAFCRYRDSTDRVVSDASDQPAVHQWARRWVWSYRAHQWDLFITRQEHEKMVRYRLQMNERHRRIASNAQMKVVEWLQHMIPQNLTATEAIRMLEVSVKLERTAAFAESANELGDEPEQDTATPDTVADLLQQSDMSEADLAATLHQILPE